MQKIINNTPFEAGDFYTNDGKTAADVYLIAIKGTFDICPDGSLSVSKEQQHIFGKPVYNGKEEQSSVRYPPDLYPLKNRIDLLVNASAYHPEGETGVETTAAIAVSNWYKELKVTGDRFWSNDFGFLKKTSPEPFESIPIIYERAFGGVDLSDDKIPDEERVTHKENPLGKGFAIKSKYLDGLKLPNIEPTGKKTNKKAKKNQTVGFGAIDSHWASRTRYAGTYDEEWEKNRFPLLPLDFDPEYFQWVPEDQQFEQLSSDDLISLYNLTPEGELHINIPSFDFEVTTTVNNRPVSMNLIPQTILIEPDLKKVYISRAGQLTGIDQRDKIIVTIKNKN